ncbi:Protein of unknown function [Bacillus mycoides]|nr:Protein of unknown function [Bacillus mycoides]
MILIKDVELISKEIAFKEE